MSDWNSKQYLKFEKQRTQPSIDLAMHLNIESPKKILDIGCGPGNSTNVLSQRFKDAYILGVDSSENMIKSAKEKYPDIRFEICDAANDLNKLDNDFDIVFSNACIQWIPDHKKLLPDMMKRLKKGGVLAIQTPLQYKQKIRKIISSVAQTQRWSSKFNFAASRVFYNLMPAEYYDILAEISDDFDMWETTYYHRMPSHQSLIDWYKGTGLRPYLNQLNDADKIEFEKDIFEEVKRAYPVQENGEIIFAFPRLFFTAKK
ncbi:MAG: methyltransferase domain-containing protein [Eubacterium sp.]